jgi:hypothetical protein
MKGENCLAFIYQPETQDTTYLLWISGYSLPDSNGLDLSEDNRTLTLLRVTRNDTGTYECGTWDPVSANPSDLVTLNVTALFQHNPGHQPKYQGSKARSLSPSQVQVHRLSPLDGCSFIFHQLYPGSPTLSLAATPQP